MFSRKAQKRMRVMWAIVGAIVILGMMALYAPALLVGATPRQQTPPPVSETSHTSSTEIMNDAQTTSTAPLPASF